MIEVVIALAITSLALGALIAATGVGVENAGLAHRHIEGTRRAQSRLAQIGVTIPLNPGEQSGDDGGGFAWRVRISPLAVHPAPLGTMGPQLTLYAVEVTIGWRGGRFAKQVALRSQRVGRGAAGNG